MLSNVQKNVIIRALQIRKERGEAPEKAILDYTRLTIEEIAEIILSLNPSASKE